MLATCSVPMLLSHTNLRNLASHGTRRRISKGNLMLVFYHASWRFEAGLVAVGEPVHSTPTLSSERLRALLAEWRVKHTCAACARSC
jgi:hypothetical protein